MIQYTVYNTATGEILRTGTAMTEASAQLQGSAPGTNVVLVGSDPVQQSIDPGSTAIVPKLLMNVGGANTTVNKTTIQADGVDTLTISPIPVGASYDIYLPANLGLIQPAPGIINDGSLTISASVRGIYSLKISFQNYMDFSVTFNAS